MVRIDQIKLKITHLYQQSTEIDAREDILEDCLNVGHTLEDIFKQLELCPQTTDATASSIPPDEATTVKKQQSDEYPQDGQTRQTGKDSSITTERHSYSSRSSEFRSEKSTTFGDTDEVSDERIHSVYPIDENRIPGDNSSAIMSPWQRMSLTRQETATTRAKELRECMIQLVTAWHELHSHWRRVEQQLQFQLSTAEFLWYVDVLFCCLK